jgi:hypothetical protein
MTNVVECRCGCHAGGPMHSSPCCYRCPVCDRRIKCVGDQFGICPDCEATIMADRNPTKYPADPDHSVSDMGLPPAGCCGWSPPRPAVAPPPEPPAGRWARLVRLVARAVRWLLRLRGAR